MFSDLFHVEHVTNFYYPLLGLSFIPLPDRLAIPSFVVQMADRPQKGIAFRENPGIVRLSKRAVVLQVSNGIDQLPSQGQRS